MGIKELKPRTILAANLKALMNQAGVNQSQLGKKADVAQSTIGRILKERHAPDLDTLHSLGKALGVTVWQLMVPHLNPSNLPVLQNASAEEQELYARLKAAAEILTPPKHQ